MKRHAVCGAFDLLARLGGGGTAEVYLARPTGSRDSTELFALKWAKPEVGVDEHAGISLVDEARIARTLLHPNIVRVHGYGEHAGRHFLVMEYVAGRSLAQVLAALARRHVTLSFEDVAWLMAQIAEALDFEHGRTDRYGHPLNIVHRDLNPRNIMVTFDGVPKLIDFGVARAMGRSVNTGVGRIKGTSCYMSPEQARGLGVDGRSDVFALGIVLYELLAGRLPFRGETEREMLLAVANGEHTPIDEAAPGAPASLRAIVDRSMQFLPRRRFESAAEPAALLREFAASISGEGQVRLAGLLDHYFPGAWRQDRERVAALFAS